MIIPSTLLKFSRRTASSPLYFKNNGVSMIDVLNSWADPENDKYAKIITPSSKFLQVYVFSVGPTAL